MAYASWSVVFGEQPSAAKWNILGTNDASFNDGTGIASKAIDSENLTPTVGFYATTTQSITATSVDVITYSEVVDYGADFNPATGVFTAPYAGFYMFALEMGITDAQSTTGRWDVNLNKNGSSVAHVHSAANATNGDPAASIAICINAAANDTFLVNIINNSGGTESLVNSYFSGFMIGQV